MDPSGLAPIWPDVYTNPLDRMAAAFRQLPSYKEDKGEYIGKELLLLVFLQIG